MSLKDIQENVEEWTSQFIPQYWNPLEINARLMEEIGELSREINHRWGPKRKKSIEDKAELGDEIADVIFTLCCLANSQKISLQECWDKMMQKYSKRDNDRWEKKERTKSSA